MQRRKILGLGWLTLFGFSALGIVVHLYWLNQPIKTLFEFKWNPGLQLGLGLIGGLFFGFGAWLIIRQKFFKDQRTKYSHLFSGLKLKTFDIWFISFCAGAGEEIFFRGGIQPWLGVEITAIIFVAVHGYLNPMNWRLSLYGLYMTAVIVLIGYMAQYFGLLTAIIAHMMIDVVLFTRFLEEPQTIHSNLLEIPREENNFTTDEAMD